MLPLFALTVNVMKLLALTAVAAEVGAVTLTVVPHALLAGEPLVPKALPRVNPPIVTLAPVVVADWGEEPPPV